MHSIFIRQLATQMSSILNSRIKFLFVLSFIICWTSVGTASKKPTQCSIATKTVNKELDQKQLDYVKNLVSRLRTFTHPNYIALDSGLAARRELVEFLSVLEARIQDFRTQLIATEDPEFIELFPKFNLKNINCIFTKLYILMTIIA